MHLVVLQWILPEGNGPAEWAERSARAEWQCCERDYIDCDRDRDRERGLRCKIWRARFSKTIGRHQVAAGRDARPRDSFGKLDKLAADCCCCCFAPYGQATLACEWALHWCARPCQSGACVPRWQLCAGSPASPKELAACLSARLVGCLSLPPSSPNSFRSLGSLADQLSKSPRLDSAARLRQTLSQRAPQRRQRRKGDTLCRRIRRIPVDKQSALCPGVCLNLLSFSFRFFNRPHHHLGTPSAAAVLAFDHDSLFDG